MFSKDFMPTNRKKLEQEPLNQFLGAEMQKFTSNLPMKRKIGGTIRLPTKKRVKA